LVAANERKKFFTAEEADIALSRTDFTWHDAVTQAMVDKLEAIRNETDYEPSQDTLESAVRELFEKYLDVQEESDSGNMFHPVVITCCRVHKTKPLNELLDKIRNMVYTTDK
jgi:3'-phosphoadenosine 5'-phosphosulfate sulfotransferase (PAPS reductase)/FAD synthetase